MTEFDTQFKKLLNKNKEMLEKGNLQKDFEGYTYEGSVESQEMHRSTFIG